MVSNLGYVQKDKDDTQVMVDIHDFGNKRFAEWPEDEETELDNMFTRLLPDEKRCVAGLAYINSRKMMEITFYEDIKWGVSGLQKVIGNMHAALIKRDPKTYRHNHVWIQVQLKREFDRLSKNYSPENMTRTEDLERTLSYIDKQAVAIFKVAHKCRVGEIQIDRLDALIKKASKTAQKILNLGTTLTCLASDSPRPVLNWDMNTALLEEDEQISNTE